MKRIFKSICCFAVLLSSGNILAQSLYVGENAEFYLKKDLVFTTSNTVVEVANTGVFSVEVGNTWGDTQEYVNGSVTAYGNGETKLPTGNTTIYAPVVANHSNDVVAEYFFAVPESGTNGTNVNAISDKEYWTLTGNAVITLPWSATSDMTNLVNSNGGKLSSVAIVGYDSGTWDLVSAPLTNTVTGDLTNGTVTSDTNVEVDLDTYTQFTFGIDNQAVLGIDDLFVTNGVTILSNPVQGSEGIRFSVENDMPDLNITLYDITGKQIRRYKDVQIFNNIGSLPNTSVNTGIYFLKFDSQGKQGVKKIILQ